MAPEPDLLDLRPLPATPAVAELFGEEPLPDDRYTLVVAAGREIACLRENAREAVLRAVPAEGLDPRDDPQKVRYAAAVVEAAVRRAVASGRLWDLLEAESDRFRDLLLHGLGEATEAPFALGRLRGWARRFGSPYSFKPRHVQIDVELPGGEGRALLTLREAVPAWGECPIRVAPLKTVLIVGLDETTTEPAGHLRDLGARVVAVDQGATGRSERRLELADRGVPFLGGNPEAVLAAVADLSALDLVIEGYSAETVLTPEGAVEQEAQGAEAANRALVESLRERFAAPVHAKAARPPAPGGVLPPLEAALVELLRPLGTVDPPVEDAGAEVIVDVLLTTTRPYDAPNRHSTDGPSLKAARGLEERLLEGLRATAPEVLAKLRPIADPARSGGRTRALAIQTRFGPWTAHTLVEATVRARTADGRLLTPAEYARGLARQPNVRLVSFDSSEADGEEFLLLDDTAIQNLLFGKLQRIHAGRLIAVVWPLSDEAFRVAALIPQPASQLADRLRAALDTLGLVGGDAQLAERLVAESLDLPRVDARLAATFPPAPEARPAPGPVRRRREVEPRPLPFSPELFQDRPDLAPAAVARALGNSIARAEEAGEYTRYRLGPAEYLLAQGESAVVHVVEAEDGLSLRTAPVPGLDPKRDADKAWYYYVLIDSLRHEVATRGSALAVLDRHGKGLKRFLAARRARYAPDPQAVGRSRAPFAMGRLGGSRIRLGSERVPADRQTVQVVIFRRDDPSPDPPSTTIAFGWGDADPLLFVPSAGLLVFGFGNIAGDSGVLAQRFGFWVTAYNRTPNDRALHALEHGIALYEFDETFSPDGARLVRDGQRRAYAARGLPLGPPVRALLRDGVVVGETERGAPVRIRVRCIVDGLFGTVVHPLTGNPVKASELYKELLFDEAEAAGIPTIYEGVNNPSAVARGKVVSQDFVLDRAVHPRDLLPTDAAGRFQSVQCVSCNTTNMWTLSLALAGLPPEVRGELDVNVLLLRKMNDQYVGEHRQATGTQGMILFMQPKYVRDLWQFVQSIEAEAVRERETEAFRPILDGFSAQVGHQPGTDLHFGLMFLRRRDGRSLDAAEIKRRLADAGHRHLQLIDFPEAISSMEFLRRLYYRVGLRSLYVHPAVVLQNGRDVLVVFFTPHLFNVKLNTLVFAAILSRLLPPTLAGVRAATELVDRALRVEAQKAQLRLYFPPQIARPLESPPPRPSAAPVAAPAAVREPFAAEAPRAGPRQPIYFFGAGQTESLALDPGTRRYLLGGKGAGLAEMSGIEYEDPVPGRRTTIPVPPGYTITTEQALRYFQNGRRLPDDLHAAIVAYQARLEAAAGKRLGDPGDPLLVSVRSGARISMPGMMDTVLNLGLTDASVLGLARRSGDERFAWDSYQRFVEMFADVVLGVRREEHLKPIRERLLAARGQAEGTPLGVETLKALVREYQGAVRRVTGEPFPQDPRRQLELAIEAVFNSSFNERTVTFRKIHELPEDTVSAVSVVAMVFGNRGPTSATGVAFTRDPLTGEKVLNGEYLTEAQGEDVVAGIRTGRKIAQLQEEPYPELHAAFGQLVAIQAALERHYRDAQDIEFTIEEGRLWILQCRSLDARSGRAALRSITDMVAEGLLTPAEALLKFGDPERLNEVLQPIFDPEAEQEAEAQGRYLTRGIPASVGAASGEVVFSSEEAERRGGAGTRIILVRPETSPDDVGGMQAAQGILTSRGGRTSHAAIVARGMGKAAVVGADAVVIDGAAGLMRVGERVIHEGEVISLDGSNGKVYLGALRVIDSPVKRKLEGEAVDLDGEDLYRRFMTLIRWARDAKALEVRANADRPPDVALALRLGAEGLGLVRTEHAILAAEAQRFALSALLLALVANEKAEIDRALDLLFPFLREDAFRIFQELDHGDPETARPATIRLFDPVVNEFLPVTDQERVKVAAILGITPEEVRLRAERVREINPMLGHRGVRLVVASPEIAVMQARAVFEAAADLIREGWKALPELEIPLVIGTEEVQRVASLIRQVAHRVMRERGVHFEFRIGVMVETPAAVRTANVYAPQIQFISFGMNDLTQTVLAMSRDDAGKFLRLYQEEGIFSADPFRTIDVEVVGSFVREATLRARSTNPDIYVGAAGDLGGDPLSVGFFHDAGLDGVSATPWLIPIAILSAAQANLRNPRGGVGRSTATPIRQADDRFAWGSPPIG